MRDSDKRRLISSFFSFACSAFVIGVFFYTFINSENYYRYEPIVNYFTFFFFALNGLILFTVYKYNFILSKRDFDFFENEITKGLQAGNTIGLLLLSIVNLVLFNPIFSLIEYLNKGDDVTNSAILLINCSLFMGAFLLHSSRKQIQSLAE